MNLTPDPMVSVLAGCAAGISKTLVGHPFNTWKLHRQSGLRPPERLRDLYQGLYAPLGRSAVEHGFHMGLRDVVIQQLGCAGLDAWAQNPFAVGLLAGVPQAIVIAPIDYACTRLQLAKPVDWCQCFRGLSWLMSKEMLAGMVFFGIYDGSRGLHPILEQNAGARGSLAAVAALTATYPLDTLKTRSQAGVCSPTTPLHAGLGFSLVKCVVCNFVALAIYDIARTHLQRRRIPTPTPPSV